MQAALLASYRNLGGLLVRSGRSPHPAGRTLSFPVTVTSPDRERSGIRPTAVLRGARVVIGPLTASTGRCGHTDRDRHADTGTE